MNNDNLQNKVSLKCAFYIRVSTEEQAEMFGIDLQKSSLEAIVKSKGNHEDGTPILIKPLKEHIYIDKDVSGTIPLEERPAFARMQEDIINSPEGKKPFDLVLVYKIDRFARKLKILLNAVDFLQEREISFISSQESLDTSTPFGKAMLGILGVIAELEIDTIKERTHGGRIEAIKSGKMMSSMYGYTKKEDGRPKINEEQAKVIRMIFDDYVVLRMSIEAIANKLKNMNVPRPAYSKGSGSRQKRVTKPKHPINYWMSSTVRRILVDEIYIGNYYYDKSKKGKQLKKSEWKLSPYKFPSIVDELTFAKAQKLLKTNYPKTSGISHNYLLTSLLKCDCCYDEQRDKGVRIAWHGERKKHSKNKYSYLYRCSRKRTGRSSFSCDALPLPATEIENYIIEFVLKLLENPSAVYKYQQELQSSKAEYKLLIENQKELERLINGIPEIIKRLKEQHKAGLIAVEELKELVDKENNRSKELNKKLLGVKHNLAQHSINEGYLSAFKLFRKNYNSTIKQVKNNKEYAREIIHTLIDEIVVYSRPVTKDDKIAGRKRANQQIPNKLHIKLKLPQEFLADLTAQIERQLYEEDIKLGNIKNYTPEYRKKRFGGKNLKW